jgi:hypothetical protein
MDGDQYCNPFNRAPPAGAPALTLDADRCMSSTLPFSRPRGKSQSEKKSMDII